MCLGQELTMCSSCPLCLLCDWVSKVVPGAPGHDRVGAPCPISRVFTMLVAENVSPGHNVAIICVEQTTD